MSMNEYQTGTRTSKSTVRFRTVPYSCEYRQKQVQEAPEDVVDEQEERGDGGGLVWEALLQVLLQRAQQDALLAHVGRAAAVRRAASQRGRALSSLFGVTFAHV